jgi:glycosyltransferase involved in cell wall biosynthesis
MAKSAFFSPRRAFRSRAAQIGIATFANRIETRMSFCIVRGGSEAHASARRNARGPLRVLFVTPYLPSPPRFGGQRRLHGLISGLAASHEVSVLSFVDPHEDQQGSRCATQTYCCRVATVPNRRSDAGWAKKRALQVGSLLLPWSYERIVHRARAFQRALDEMLATEPYDVVHFEFSHMAVYRREQAPDRPRGGAPRSRPVFLLDEHNIEYDLVRQTARAGGSAVRRLFSAVDWRKVYAEERWAWTRLDGCTLTSAVDQSTVHRHAPEVPTAVVPNGVDLDFFQPRAGAAPREARTLLFFGAVDYYPNTEGLLFFLDEVLPRLSPRVPRVRLCIVGRRPPSAVLAHRGPDVEITGVVDDIRPYLERAAAVIVPLRIGGGTRLKILEAMAMGKAVVSTSLGAEGIDVVPGRDLLIADDADGFAAQCARLLDDPGLSDRLGAAARRVVETGYGWGASVRRLSAFYGEVLEARGAA